jgi:hypothetical protein
MKTIKSVNGFKQIDATSESAAIVLLKEILMEHRNTLITRLLSDLSTYIRYRFNFKPDALKIETIKDQLHSLKNSSIELEKYDTILEQFLNNENIFIHAEPFYKEIDEKISWELTNTPMMFIN